LLVDSTGIKIYGEGEWLDQKRTASGHAAAGGNFISRLTPTPVRSPPVKLTPDDVGDVSAGADLLDQIDGSVGSMTGDGAMMAKRFTMRLFARRLVPRRARA
jgi:hypothetical protein